MEFNELIQARRSCRSYTDKPVDAALIREIIGKAQMAPSWKNSQTAKYYVASTPEAIEKVLACLPEFNQNNAKNAGALIVTTFIRDISGFTAGAAVNELSNKWGAYDLGLANGYFVLAAKDAGLDTLIMGIRDAAALRKALGIPKTEQIVSVMALGYGEGTKANRPRKEIDEILTIL